MSALNRASSNKPLETYDVYLAVQPGFVTVRQTTTRYRSFSSNDVGDLNLTPRKLSIASVELHKFWTAERATHVLSGKQKQYWLSPRIRQNGLLSVLLRAIGLEYGTHWSNVYRKPKPGFIRTSNDQLVAGWPFPVCKPWSLGKNDRGRLHKTRFSSSVLVEGSPKLRLRTGCHDSSCSTPEVQTFVCK